MKYMVLYTDGSARPNPGRTGYGIHGYIGEIQEEKKKVKNVESKYVCSVKGYINKKEKEEYDLIEPDLLVEEYGRFIESNTNNTAELEGVIRAIHLANEYLNEEDTLTILMDSDYVYKFVKGYMENGSHNYKANEAHLDKLIKLLDNVKYKLNVEWIKAHVGLIGNTEADRLSNMGRLLKGDVVDGLVFKRLTFTFWDYWKYDVDITPLLKKNNKLLLTLKNTSIFKDDSLHCITNYKRKEIDELGKKMNNITYTIVKTKDIPKEIQILLDYIKDGTDLEKPYVINLADLFNKKIAKHIIHYGKDYLIKVRTMMELILTIDETPYTVAMEVFPENLAWNVVENFKQVYNLLENKDKEDIVVVDIKDVIFDNIDEKKFKINIDGKNHTVLKEKLELPDISLLKKLKKDIEEFKLIFNKTNDAIYNISTYIKVNNGEWMFNTAKYNLNIIK